MGEVSSDILFQRYAVPCAFQLVMSRKLSQDQLDDLEQRAAEGNAWSREVLEETFPTAFSRIRTCFPDQDVWEIDVVRGYFRDKHNPIVKDLDVDDRYRNLCMVHEAEVLEVIDDEWMRVCYEGSELFPEGSKYRGRQERRVKRMFVPDVVKGEKVTIHWKYAVEKI